MRMPWKKSSVEDERLRLVTLAIEGRSVTELAESFGVSRKTAYKWIERHEKRGWRGLSDLSRAPHQSPQATSEEVVGALVRMKKRHRRWGPKKLLVLLAEAEPELELPSASTAWDILKRHGLVVPRRPRGRLFSSMKSLGPLPSRPNELWCADFKGEFKLLNGEYCFPLTVTDAATRYVLACVGLSGPFGQATQEIFETLFQRYGLPKAIRTDNGRPFASEGLAGLSVVSARWLEHGVVHERTRPAKPQDNGRHERFHRTLKEATALPPRRNMKAQQRAFDAFCEEFNNKRPHEALGQRTPATLYMPSSRRRTAQLSQPKYPAHFYISRADPLGNLQLRKMRFHLGPWAHNVNIGLEELPADRFRVHLSRFALGELDLRTARIIPYASRDPGHRARRSFESHHKIHSSPQA